MSMTPLPSFAQITTTLQQADLLTSTSEVHGILTGFICGGTDVNTKQWLAHINDIINEGMGLPPSVKTLVISLHAQIAEQMHGHQSGLALLLPCDDKPLDDRCDAMSQWAQGFLVGFGMVQSELDKAIPEVQELFKDIRDISQVSLEFDAENEEFEIAYSEIVNYLQIGVVLCFNHFSHRPNTTTSNTIH